MSQVKAGAAYVELTTRNSRFLRGLADAKRKLQDFGASARMLGRQIFTVGAGMAAPMAASTAIFMSFDDAMRQVRAITQATDAEFAKLTDRAKQLGATTSFAASEVASLMTELGRAGFKPDQIMDMTAAVMNLARATGTDATLASGIMAATIRQFGMEAGEATRVADGLTAAANKSFNSVESLGEALKYAAPVAADANMSLEETLATLGSPDPRLTKEQIREERENAAKKAAAREMLRNSISEAGDAFTDAVAEAAANRRRSEVRTIGDTSSQSNTKQYPKSQYTDQDAAKEAFKAAMPGSRITAVTDEGSYWEVRYQR